MSGAEAGAARPGGPALVLVGPPGAGKTTVGGLVAAALGRSFRDTDADVEHALGASVSEIFVEHGEARFRRAEHEAVLAALAQHDGVLALGGGAVQDPGTRAALRGHPVAFLDVGVHDAIARIGLNTARPLMLDNPRATFIRLLQARRPLYEEIATFTVATGGRTPEAVADEIIRALRLSTVADGRSPETCKES